MARDGHADVRDISVDLGGDWRLPDALDAGGRVGRGDRPGDAHGLGRPAPSLVGHGQCQLANLQFPEGCAAGDPPPMPGEISDELAMEVRLTAIARSVSIVSVVASLVAAFFGLGIGIVERVLSLAGFGVESLLDAISSALVLWRFKKPKRRQHADAESADRAKTERDARRERNSSIGIGSTFVASGALLMASSFVKYVSWDPHSTASQHEERAGMNYGMMLSGPSLFLFGFLSYVKFSLAKSLRSQVLLKDALCSALGAVLASIAAVAAIVEDINRDDPEVMEMVDIVAGSIIAAILLWEGGRTLHHNLCTDGWTLEHQPMA